MRPSWSALSQAIVCYDQTPNRPHMDNAQYLLKKEDQSVCHTCDNLFTVTHILIECPDFTHIRNKFYTTDVCTLFREVGPSRIAECLKEIGIYNKI